MAWFVDNANTLYVLFGLIAAAFLIMWRSYQWRKEFLGYAAGALAIMGVIWLLTLFVPTDRKQLESNVHAMANAVVAGKVDDLFKHISKDFNYHEMTRDKLYAA